MYRVVIESRVYKDLDKVPAADLGKIYQSVESLEADPRKLGSKKLKGYPDRYRLRQGQYRIIYSIFDAGKEVRILLVRHRKDVYDFLK